jgi:hypothetical protein
MWRRIILAIVILILAGIPPARAQTPPSGIAWGQSLNGLSVGIALAGWVNKGQPFFEIRFRNVNSAGYILNLGVMLGDKMWPSNVTLLLTPAGGTTQKLVYLDSVNPQVGGRVDDFLVAMGKNASYSLRVDLVDFIETIKSRRPTPLPQGRYRIALHFHGEAAKHFNTGTFGLQSLNYWRGRLESETLEFEVGP